MTTQDGSEFEGIGLEQFRRTNRLSAILLIDDRDLDAQLVAIKGALRRNREAEKQSAKEMKEIESQIRDYQGDDDQYQMYMDNDRVDKLEESVFQDAAHSMSAVGMLAPFVESLFVAIFQGLSQRSHTTATGDPRAKAAQGQYWNPQIVFGKNGARNDIVAGIEQLARSTELHPFFPKEYQQALSALFGYRNNMFHNGFEWPIEARKNFQTRIKNCGWPCDWFKMASRDDEPWIFYISDEFIEHCLKMIDEVLDGVGEYLKQHSA